MGFLPNSRRLLRERVGEYPATRAQKAVRTIRVRPTVYRSDIRYRCRHTDERSMSHQLAFDIEMGGSQAAPKGKTPIKHIQDDFRILLAVTDDDLAPSTIQLGKALALQRAAT